MIDGIKWNGFQLNNINNYNKLYHSSQQSMILPHMGLEGGEPLKWLRSALKEYLRAVLCVPNGTARQAEGEVNEHGSIYWASLQNINSFLMKFSQSLPLWTSSPLSGSPLSAVTIHTVFKCVFHLEKVCYSLDFSCPSSHATQKASLETHPAPPQPCLGLGWGQLEPTGRVSCLASGCWNSSIWHI